MKPQNYALIIISLAVVLLHAAFIGWTVYSWIPIKFVKPKEFLIVHTVSVKSHAEEILGSHQNAVAEAEIKSSPPLTTREEKPEQPALKRDTPFEEEKKTKPKPLPQKPKADLKKTKPAQPKTKPEPQKAAAKPKDPVSKPASKETADKPLKKELSRKEKILEKAKENVARLEETRKNLRAAAAGKSLSLELKDVGVIESLSIDAEGVHGAEDAGYYGLLAGRLKQALRLPEIGSVKIRLTLDREGNVSLLETVKTESEYNKKFVEATLRKIKFPPFGSSFEGERSHTFSITLANE